ncbi:glycosyltransferase 87 family protein [Streptomyces sp. BPTC-684]|uniref:glycosyltransferase 87 family protein n=1 Tax=Streptomyces sp. BPTC-684 TaxID=3043734 RepID=UPI0024B0D87B|nr:glycosyltransferase 87 family protein [Streptomyces sp. BPTC-684]WHM41331.1 glycosyltransferase 87 family protein [Streptomyces sp. BPTC-684]
MADALVYRAEGAAVAHGSDLYGFTVTRWHLPATYPPFAAILFVPTAWLPVPVLKAAFAVGNALLLALLVRLSCRFARIAPRPAALLAATAAGLWLEPVFQTLLFGQINLALTCLVLWDLTRPPGSLGKGFGVGIAAGIKLTPALFLLYALLKGRRREAGTGAVAFAGTVLLGALVLPGASADFWTRRLFETDRVGKAWIVDNQSLQGLVARLLHTPAPGGVWVAVAAAVAGAGLWTARRADDRWGVLVIALTALLVSPISWSHHWVWCVPLIAVLVAEGRVRTAVAVATVFAARTLWLVPHEGDLDLQLHWWQQPLASPYPLLGLAVSAQVAVRLRTGGGWSRSSPRPLDAPLRGAH